MRARPLPTWREWIAAQQRAPFSKAQLPPEGLALCTGQDSRALNAIAECWQLYAVSDDAGRAGALGAVRALLPALQRRCQPFARELIAWAMEWTDRDTLWPQVQGETRLGIAIARAVERSRSRFTPEAAALAVHEASYDAMRAVEVEVHNAAELEKLKAVRAAWSGVFGSDEEMFGKDAIRLPDELQRETTRKRRTPKRKAKS